MDIDGNLIHISNFPTPDYSQFKDLSPKDLFELFFVGDVFQRILEESRKYALFLNLPNPNITMGDDMANEMVKRAS